MTWRVFGATMCLGQAMIIFSWKASEDDVPLWISIVAYSLANALIAGAVQLVVREARR